MIAAVVAFSLPPSKDSRITEASTAKKTKDWDRLRRCIAPVLRVRQLLTFVVVNMLIIFGSDGCFPPVLIVLANNLT